MDTEMMQQYDELHQGEGYYGGEPLDQHDPSAYDPNGYQYETQVEEQQEQPEMTPSEHAVAGEEDETTEIDDEDPGLTRTVGRSAALVRRKTAALMERMAAGGTQPGMPSLAQGIEQLLNMELPALPAAGAKGKRARPEQDGAAEPEAATSGPVVRRNTKRREGLPEGFNPASFIGCIFLRVQAASAPAPLVHFEDSIHLPQWFKESIDGVQPVITHEEYDCTDLNLECMGKLVDGNVLPATLSEVATYFTHVLGDPRTSKDITPRVLIAIQCDRAKGWFTYKRDNDNNSFAPVVLCAAENGRGLEEVSPAHFEVHRAQCAQKKWRQSFKVLGAQKLHKVTSLAQAALGDVLRHLERILGTERPIVRPVYINGTLPGVLNYRPLAIEGPGGLSMLPPLNPGDPITMANGVAAAMLTQGGADDPNSMMNRTTTPSEQDTVRKLMSAMGGMQPQLGSPQAGMAGVASQGFGAGRPVVPGVAAPAVGSRVVIGGKPILRRATTATEDGATTANGTLTGAGPGLGAALAAAGSGGVSAPTGAQAGLLAAALTGVSFNELLQLVIDNTTRKQQHAQQALLLKRLAAIQANSVDKDNLVLAAELEAAVTGRPAAVAGGAGQSGAPEDAAEAIAPGVLSAAECDAIRVVVKSVRGPDVAHAVRGVLQHVAMQYAAEQPQAATAALAAAVTKAAVAEGHVAAPAAAAAAAAAEPAAKAASTPATQAVAAADAAAADAAPEANGNDATHTTKAADAAPMDTGSAGADATMASPADTAAATEAQ